MLAYHGDDAGVFATYLGYRWEVEEVKYIHSRYLPTYLPWVGVRRPHGYAGFVRPDPWARPTDWRNREQWDLRFAFGIPVQQVSPTADLREDDGKQQPGTESGTRRKKGLSIQLVHGQLAITFQPAKGNKE